MNKYELVIIVDAKIPQEQKEAVCKQATDAIVKSGGKVTNSQVWLEKHKFAFRIKKCIEGTYYLVKFEGEGNVISKAKQILGLNDNILRSLISKIE